MALRLSLLLIALWGGLPARVAPGRVASGELVDGLVGGKR